jgi:SAM-dependent methyltransferase
MKRIAGTGVLLAQTIKRWLPAPVRARLRRWRSGPYDYRAAYRKVDLDRDYWSIVGPSTEEEFVRLGQGKRKLLIDLGLRPDSRVLDVGCGTGQLTAALEDYLSPEGSYLGTDIAPEAVAFCRKKFRRPNFRFLANEMTQVPVEQDRFGFVYFGSVFTHLLPREVGAMLREVHRLLETDGRVIADAFLGDIPGGSRGDRARTVIDEALLLKMFAAAGFAHQVVTGWPCEPGVRRSIFLLQAPAEPAVAAVEG